MSGGGEEGYNVPCCEGRPCSSIKAGQQMAVDMHTCIHYFQQYSPAQFTTWPAQMYVSPPGIARYARWPVQPWA